MSRTTGLGNNLSTLLNGTARQRNRAKTDKAHTPTANPTSDSTVTITPGSTPAVTNDDHSGDRLVELSVDEIVQGEYQPRREFDAAQLNELAESIKSEGVIQPVLVRSSGKHYELIAGERRWRAAQLAGLKAIPAIVRDMDDESVAAASLIENIQRADLNPLEEAAAFERLCEEFKMTHQEVGERVGRSRVSVSNLIRLLELDDEVKPLVDTGQLDMGHARALLSATPEDQRVIAKRVIEKGLSVRAVEKLVKELREGKQLETRIEPELPDPKTDARVEKIGDWLLVEATLKARKNGAGKLELSYASAEELEFMLERLEQAASVVVPFRLGDG